MFVAYQCGSSSSTAPLTEYPNNEIYQELPKKRNSFTNTDEKLYTDMKRSKGYKDELEKLTRDDNGIMLTVKLKAAATKKMKLRVTGYLEAEYCYTLSSKGMIMSYKNYSISEEIYISA